MAPWPGFEPGSRYIATSHVESGGLTAPGTLFAKARQPPILDRTILPGHLGISVCKRKGYLNFSFIEGLSGSRWFLHTRLHHIESYEYEYEAAHDEWNVIFDHIKPISISIPDGKHPQYSEKAHRSQPEKN